MSVSVYDQHLENRPFRRLWEKIFPPRHLDPLHGIPTEDNSPKLILRVPRRFKKRAFDHVDHTKKNKNKKRPGHSHAIASLSHPKLPAIHAAFHPEIEIDYQRFENIPSIFKLFIPDIWIPRRGKIINDRDLHDVARIYILTEDQYQAAKAEIERWKKNPPDYQVTGMWGANCARFAISVIESTGFSVPPKWHQQPWPHVMADDILKEARKGDPDPLIRNITPEMTVGAFVEQQERLCLPPSRRIVPLVPTVPGLNRAMAAIGHKLSGNAPQTV